MKSRPVLRRSLFGLAIAFQSVLSSVAFAEDDPIEVVVISLENDFFTGSDNNYTNGVSLTWSSDKIMVYDETSLLSKWARFGSFLPGFDPDLEQSYVGFSVIHEMNTPTDITLVNPPLDDQPYSGVLLLGTSFFSKSERWVNAWDIRVGAVGPSTQADHIQTYYHDLIGADEPRGWDTQLQDELIFNVGYTGAYRLLEDQNGSAENWRLTVLGNGEVGTYLTAIGTGALLEYGNDLPDTVATSSLGQGLGSGVGLGSTPQDEFNWALYAGIGGYGVAHYLPLDGTVFRDSRSVDSEPFILTASLGVTMRYKKLIVSVGISAGATPFEDRDDDIDYGAVSIGWHF
ncbi:MAG: lipid A deacylase LpxR family protein [Pseudomonadota bacterium]